MVQVAPNNCRKDCSLTEYLRTPDENFADLPNFPYEPRFHQWQDLRMHYVDEDPEDASTF